MVILCITLGKYSGSSLTENSKGGIAHPALRFLPKNLWLLGEALSPHVGALFRKKYKSTGPKDLM